MLKKLVHLDRKPVLIVGLPRSGTTWIGSTLSTARGIKYFYEPFNFSQLPDVERYAHLYLRSCDLAREFETYLNHVLAGKNERDFVNQKLSPVYKQYRWLPGRVLVKDVHCFFALDWIQTHTSMRIAVVVRHPCGVAESIFRLYGEKVGDRLLSRLMNQPQLIQDYLIDFQDLFERAQGFWQKFGLFWGATYYLLQQQQKQHPNWLFIQHEELCRNPKTEYRKVFERLHLEWTAKTDIFLNQSTSQDSGQPYVPERITRQEPNKWKYKLEPQQIQHVMEFVRPFNLQYYSDSSSSV